MRRRKIDKFRFSRPEPEPGLPPDKNLEAMHTGLTYQRCVDFLKELGMDNFFIVGERNGHEIAVSLESLTAYFDSGEIMNNVTSINEASKKFDIAVKEDIPGGGYRVVEHEEMDAEIYRKMVDRKITDMILNYSVMHGGAFGTPEGTVLEYAESAGIKREDALSSLERLKEEGRAYVRRERDGGAIFYRLC